MFGVSDINCPKGLSFWDRNGGKRVEEYSAQFFFFGGVSIILKMALKFQKGILLFSTICSLISFPSNHNMIFMISKFDTHPASLESTT